MLQTRTPETERPTLFLGVKVVYAMLQVPRKYFFLLYFIYYLHSEITTNKKNNNVGREPAAAWPITAGPYRLKVASKSVIIKNNMK